MTKENGTTFSDQTGPRGMALTIFLKFLFQIPNISEEK